MTKEQKAPTAMNVMLWIAQVLLAATFIWAAFMKLFQSDQLSQMWAWVADHPMLVKFTGVVDLLAGIGLVLPAVLRIQPKLTIFAAYGTVMLMIAASLFHIVRGEASQISFNIFVALIAVLIAWGRQTKAPIIPKR